MTTLKSNLLRYGPSGADGQSFTVANSGGTNGDAGDTITASAGGSPHWQQTGPKYDSFENAVLFAQSAASASALHYNTGLSLYTFGWRIYWYPTRIPPALSYVGWSTDPSTSRHIAWGMDTTQKLFVRNIPAASTFITGPTIPLNQWSRLELQFYAPEFDSDAPGSCAVRFYTTNPDGTTPDFTASAPSAIGENPQTDIAFGLGSNTAQTFDGWRLAAFKLTDGEWPGPYTPPVSPSVQEFMEMGAVLLNG